MSDLKVDLITNKYVFKGFCDKKDKINIIVCLVINIIEHIGIILTLFSSLF